MYYKVSYKLVQDTINEISGNIQELSDELNNSRFPQDILDRLCEANAELRLLEDIVKRSELVDGK